jgi:hypothetical protein
MAGPPTDTVNDLLLLADKVWEDLKATPADSPTEASLHRLHGRHPHFARGFPVVLRWLVESRRYYRPVMRRYLTLHAATDQTTRASFLTLQAEYLVLCYKHENRGAPPTLVQEYRGKLVAALLAEDAELMRGAGAGAEPAPDESVRDAAERVRLRAQLLERRSNM